RVHAGETISEWPDRSTRLGIRRLRDQEGSLRDTHDQSVRRRHDPTAILVDDAQPISDQNLCLAAVEAAHRVVDRGNDATAGLVDRARSSAAADERATRVKTVDPVKSRRDDGVAVAVD